MKLRTLNSQTYKIQAKPAQRFADATAFTCVDLMVTIAVLLVLSAIVIPALGRATASSSAAQCMNSLRLQGVAWAMYSADANGLIECHPWLSINGHRLAGVANTNSWAPGYAAAGPHNSQYGPMPTYSATNPIGFTKSIYFPYLKDVSLFHCPADRRSVGNAPVLRSYSMNNYMNGAPFGPGLQFFVKMEQITRPSATWVMIDEDKLTIDDAMFAVALDGRGFVNLPGRRHENSYTMNFADGRAEIYTLKEPALIDATSPPGGAGVPNGSSMAEYRFLTNLTTYP